MVMNLSVKWTERLQQMPESGMGYQKVRVRLRNGRELRNVLVQNGERLSLPEEAQEFSENDIQDISLERQR